MEIMNNVLETTVNPEPTATDLLDNKEAPVADPDKEKEEDSIAKRMAIISRMDKKARDRDREIKERERSIDERLNKAKDAMEFYETFQKNPLEAFKRAGLDVNEFYSNAITDTELNEDPLKKELYEIKEKLSAKEQAEQEALKKQREQAETSMNEKKVKYVSYLNDEVKKESDKFPLLSAGEDYGETIYKMQEKYHAKTGKHLPNEEAFSMLHTHIENNFKSVLESNEKVRNFFTTLLGKKSDDVSSELGFTLSDDMRSSTSVNGASELSREDRAKNAIDVAKQLFNKG